MQTLENLEQKFLSAIEIKPFELGDIHASINSDKKLSPEQSRHDIATLAQMFINAYSGWPFYPKLLRLRILNKLNRIYDKITHPITAAELFAQLKPIIEIMPDNHLWIKLGDNLAKYPHKPRIDVGTNLAITHGNGKKYWIDKIGNVGVIAFSKCFAPDDNENLEQFRNRIRDVMDGTRAIIIDMRDNGGGSPLIMSMICDEIMGPVGIPRAKRMRSRTTPQAQELYQYSTLSRDHIDKTVDPTIVADNTKFKLPTDYKPLYDRPIYILQNNKTASSAEHLQAQLRYHPQMQIVGSNSSGCMQYTNYQTLKLEHSGILIQLASVYAEFFGIKHFETHGFTPDIKCPDGTDAFAVAMADIETKGKTMTKIPTIREMEELLLRDSTTADLIPGMPDTDMPEKQITATDVKHDVSVLARLLIRAYVGWPVHSEIIKRKILKNLVDIYNNAHDMTAMEFFEQLKPVLSYIPDNHISLRFNKRRVGTHKTRKTVNVGKNIAGDKQIATQVKNGIAIIGFTRMLRNDDFANTILEFAKNTLPKSTALIIDLRGNGGGNSFYSDKFSEHLCGTWIDSMKEVYVRATPEAKKLQHAAQPNAGWKDVPESEELTLWKAGKNYTANPEKAYMKPIYILTDGQTGSSAEMFLLRMIHHPCVHVVGDNSAGMEEYGNMANSFLPHSQITVAVGMNYRKLLQEDFELNGHNPDIKCPDGTDAFAVAMAKIEKAKTLQSQTPER